MGSDLTGLQVINNFDNQSFYQPEPYKLITGGFSIRSVLEFDNEIAMAKNRTPISPPRYGSYYFYRLSNATKQYQTITFANITSQDAVGEFSQFLYTGLLRTATGNPNFKYKASTFSFPFSAVLKARSKSSNGIVLAFIISIAFALMPVTIISYLINE